MSKNINTLENERIKSIKNLNNKELAIYINDLNKNFFESFENNQAQDMKFYQDKLNEVRDLLGDEYNVEDYISSSKVCFLTSKFMINDLDAQIGSYLSISYMIYERTMNLYDLKRFLNSILMTYYNHYLNKDCRNAIDFLILKLENDYKFKEDSFLEYSDRLDERYKYNTSLMNDLDNNIKYVRDRMLKIIEDLDKFLEDFDVSSEVIQDYINEYDNIKLNLLKNSKDNPIIKHNYYEGYLEKYLDFIESLKFSHNSIEFFRNVKDDVLDVIDGDAFLMIKEIHYKLMKEHYDVLSKENIFEYLPCYDVRNLKFIKPKIDN